jgi:Xaa-Pro dipeptidase
MNTNAVTAIRARLRERGLAGYVAYTPSNLFYVTGFRSYFVSEWWRMHGTVLAFVPADEDLPVTLVVGDFEAKTALEAAPDVRMLTFRLWVDLSTAEEMRSDADPSTIVRPEQFEEPELDARVREALQSSGMGSGRIATDLRHVSMGTYGRLSGAAPDASWEDFTDDMYAIRLIKEEWEVDRLRAGVELSEAGMTWASQHLEAGMTAQDVRAAYQVGVAQAASGDPRYAGYSDNWVLPTVGGITSAGYGATTGGLQPGNLVKFDCGATVGGYRSDGGRTYAFRERTPEAQHLHDVLAEAQRIARDLLRPGAVIGDVYRGAMAHVHENGYPTFNRGHVGHSIGIDSFHEEPPYISPGCTELVRPGMVFAVEVPSYTPDVGAIMIEDLVVVREHGAELLHSLPHELVVV